MNSTRGTKTLRLQRRKSGLDFSVKGGQEHGIPIVVSWIKDGGAASSNLHLGDEIIAVNGNSLQDLTHSQAVQRLKCAGAAVVLRIKPNQALEDIFSAGDSKESSLRPRAVSAASEDQQLVPESPSHSGPLPQGWGQKIDHKTGRPYFENHYTQSATWVDPRSLTPKPLQEFEWNALPPAWERYLDEHGDIYYVNHDTQTTHWDCPRGVRQQKHLRELKDFIQTQKEKTKTAEEELKQKRDLVLEKTQQLDSLKSTQMQVVSMETETTGEEEEEGGAPDLEGSSPADLIDDIMLLNEEMEVMDSNLMAIKAQLKGLGEIVKHGQLEDIGERDEYQSSAELVLELISCYSKLKDFESKLHSLLSSLEELRKRRGYEGAPVPYMLQLPPLRTQEENEETREWLHTLPDRLTGKTNCEMAVELQLLREHSRYAEALYQRVATLYSGALATRHLPHGGWEQLLDELAGYDFTPLQDQWLQLDFKEKLLKLLSLD